MKKIIYGKQARQGLKKGLDLLANSVKVTLGAKGRLVAIDRPYTTPDVTKDGVTVADEVLFEDPLLNMGANMVKSVASETNKISGDGSTTSTVLAQAIVAEGINEINKGVSLNEIKKGIEYARDIVVEYLNTSKTDIKGNKEKMIAIPTISANGDSELGNMIAGIFEKVGQHGFITVDESKNSKTTFDITEGLRVKTYPESPFFYKDDLRKKSKIKNSKVLLFVGRIENEEEILPALQLSNGSHLLIICNEMNPLLMSRMINAKIGKQIDITIVKCPDFGVQRDEIMEDIGLVCDAKVYYQEKDEEIKNVSLEDLGNIPILLVTEEYTSFINSESNDNVAIKTKFLLEKLETSEDMDEKRDLKERIARLRGGVATIYVGGTSEMEMKEKKDRVEDAVNALTCAYKEGVVVGGGVALLNASKLDFKLKGKNKSFIKGAKIVQRAIQAPSKQILKNAGYKTSNWFNTTLFDKLKSQTDSRIGYNVVEEQFVDMLDQGIVDPVMVTINALNNATSVGIMLLSVECILLDVTNYNEKEIKFKDGI